MLCSRSPPLPIRSTLVVAFAPVMPTLVRTAPTLIVVAAGIVGAAVRSTISVPAPGAAGSAVAS